MSVALIEIAKKRSLAILEGSDGTETTVPEDTIAVKNAKLMGKAISKMANLCSGGKNDVALYTNQLIKILDKTDLIGHISSDYISSNSSANAGNGARTATNHKSLTIVVPLRTEMGAAKGQPVCTIGPKHFFKATCKISARTTYYGDHNYRFATAEEIEKFYCAVLGNFGLEGKLPPAFIKYLPAE